MRTAFIWLLVLAALVWCGVVAQHALATWPHLSLDSGNDAATRAALKNAETWHLVRHAAAALLPSALAAWLALRLRAAN